MTHKPSSTAKSTVVADDGAGAWENASATSDKSPCPSMRYIIHGVTSLFFDSVKSTTSLLARSFSSRESQHPIPTDSLAVRQAGVDNTAHNLPPPLQKDPQMSYKDRLGKLRLRACGKVRQWSLKYGVIAFLCKKISKTGSSDDEDEEVDEMVAFAPVLGRLRLDALPGHASSIRRSGLSQDSENSSQLIDEACNASQITIESPPLFGAYNILFPIRFADGAKWILKIPAAGGSEDRWDPSAARALKSEALTMRLLTKKTSMPIPAVHAFGASMQNPLGCPYILMDYVDGRPLYERWFDSDHEGDLEAFRTRTLKTLAASMAQLTSFTYNQSGSLSFDAQGNVQGLVPARIYDAATMHNNLYDDEASDEAPFCDIGPFHDLRDYLLHMIKGHRPPIERFGIGINRMLALFIEWLPEHYVKAPFGLAHPDYDLQNVLVDEDGTVCGLIDWDGVAAVPRSIGCQSYPKWLTHDWDPFFYDYDIESRKLYHECGPSEHSPEELAHYRAMYAKFMEKALTGQPHGKAKSTAVESPCHQPDSSNNSEVTRKSLLIGSLSAAAWNPLSTDEIVVKIFDDIAKMAAHKAYNSAPAGFVANKLVLGPSENQKKPVQEVTIADPAEDENVECEDSELRELAWVLRYNDTDDGADMDGTQLPIAVGREDCRQQEKASNLYPKVASGHIVSKKVKIWWRRRQWSKIGSLMHKVSTPFQNNSRIRDRPSSTQPSPGRDLPTRTNGTDRSEPSRSSRTCSTERALSMATTDKNSQMTKLTEVSTQDEQVTAACTNNDDLVTVSSPRTTTSPKQISMKPGSRSKLEAQEPVNESCHTSSANNIADTSVPLPTVVVDSPDTSIRGGKGASSKPCKFIKAPCGLARRVLAKLPSCGRKTKVKEAIVSSETITCDMEEPAAHPIGFSTHKERMTALKKAATQKCPTSLNAGEAQGCGQNESQPQPKPVVEETMTTTNTKARSKASATRETQKDPIRKEEEDIGFMAASVCYALADGTLSEARMRRLKDGFHLLLDSL